MKKEVALALLGCSGILCLTAGCTPELAQIPVGQEEKNWDKVLKQNYYSFRPPRTPAPATYQPGAVPAQTDSKDLPEATDDPAGIVDRAADSKAEAPKAIEESADGKKAEVKDDGKKAEPQIATAGVPEYSKIYVVQRGDSLSSIALKNYGKASMSDVILNANSKIISDPKKLRPGIKLVIPEL